LAVDPHAPLPERNDPVEHDHPERSDGSDPSRPDVALPIAAGARAERHVRRLRSIVEAALRRQPSLRVIASSPDGGRLSIAVGDEGVLELEMRAPRCRSTVPLTARELEVLRAIASGRTNRETGEELGITAQTVKYHLTNVYAKVGVKNRTEVTRYACRVGLV